MANPTKRLGRGLGGLISQGAKDTQPISTVETTSRLQSLRISAAESGTESPAPGILGGFTELTTGLISANPYQPRKEIDDEALQGLADSIREQGLLQPIVVRKVDEGFELIAGERRLRAFRKLGIDKIPARIIEASDASSASLALIENLQREGLNPIEEALGYASLIRDFDLTQERAAERLGKSRVAVTNSLRLLRLSTDVQAYLSKGILSTGHAKVILGLEKQEEQQSFARRVIEQGWSVREAEKQIKRFRSNPPTPTGLSGLTTKSTPGSNSTEASAIRDLEKKVSQLLSADTQLKHGKNKGQLVIHYHGLDDLQRILDKIGMRSL
jgi:ParB family transcriptional regulator, chromosome partitioning protein